MCSRIINSATGSSLQNIQMSHVSCKCGCCIQYLSPACSSIRRAIDSFYIGHHYSSIHRIHLHIMTKLPFRSITTTKSSIIGRIGTTELIPCGTIISGFEYTISHVNCSRRPSNICGYSANHLPGSVIPNILIDGVLGNICNGRVCLSITYQGPARTSVR